MRKSILAVVFSIFLFGQLKAQDYKIGIKVSPTFSMTRTGTQGANTSIDGDGTAVKFMLGAFIDIGFKENYYFHTGINYATKETRISASLQNTGSNPITEQYAHEYLQLPVLLKLYTNEIVLDTRIYFNFGLIPELRLSTSNEEVSTVIVENFKGFDLAGNVGAGLERSLGPNTRLFGGLNFNLGFLNMVKDQNAQFEDITIKSNLLAVEVGIKF